MYRRSDFPSRRIIKSPILLLRVHLTGRWTERERGNYPSINDGEYCSRVTPESLQNTPNSCLMQTECKSGDLLSSSSSLIEPGSVILFGTFSLSGAFAGEGLLLLLSSVPHVLHNIYVRVSRLRSNDFEMATAAADPTDPQPAVRRLSSLCVASRQQLTHGLHLKLDSHNNTNSGLILVKWNLLSSLHFDGRQEGRNRTRTRSVPHLQSADTVWQCVLLLLVAVAVVVVIKPGREE